MRMLRCAFFAAVFVGFSLAAAPASADFEVCNNSDKAVFVAVGHWDNYSHVTQGWRIAMPGTCQITYPGDLEWQWYYVYARTAYDEFGNYEAWSGDYLLCIHWPNGFTIVGKEGCDTGFFEIDTGLSKTFTFNLE